MTSLNIVGLINAEIIDLWREEFSNRLDQVAAPLVYDKIEADGILFVGCNPALPKRGHYKAPKLADLLTDSNAVAALMEQERQARESYPYFTPCQQIANRLELRWTHVDWFFKRDTSQRNLAAEVKGSPAKADNRLNLSSFARKQIALSRRLMEACRPRIVVVVNAFASRIAKSEFDLGDLDEDGLLWADIGHRKVPVFLSGMLTGQRALDTGSRQRLEWHMLRATELMQAQIAGNGSANKS